MSTSTSTFQKLGSYSTSDGVIVTIEKGAAFDLASRTALQLSSILHMMTSHDLDDSVKHSLWLVHQMAEEVVALLPLVAQDANQWSAS